MNKVSGQKLLIYSKDYIMIVFGLFLYALGFTTFILPEKVVTGGVVGLASLCRFAFGWNVGITNYAINILLLIIAFHTVGKQFVIRTIFGATVASILIMLMDPWSYQPLVQQQPFMNIIIGSALCGMGLGITFSHNGSSGGTDIVAAMVTKHTNISFGRMMLYCDMCIISSSYLIFHSPDKIVYGLVFMIIDSIVADMVINNSRQAVQYMIFSDKWQQIADAITGDAHRGCTVLDGTGWYTKKPVKVILVMCRKLESVNIARIIKAVDDKAFITKTNVNGVYGYGFDEMKVKLSKVQKEHIDEETQPHNG
ncbi:MAG: YitT family protein [Muribaculaceae bacterium]|nr:YitT family protein [Muribaculaceae bacterium]